MNHFNMFAGVPVVICIFMSLPILAQKTRDANVTVVNDDTAPVPVKIVDGGENGAVTVVNDDTAPVPVKIVDGGENGAQTEYRVTAYTKGVFSGHIETTDGTGRTIEGRRAMDHLCKAEAGPSARVATAEEFLRASGPMPPGPSGHAWILPSKPVVIYRPDGGSSDWAAYDKASPGSIFSEVTFERALNGLSCRDHLSDDEFGMAASFRGATVFFTSCGQEFTIACSSPVSISP